MLTSQSVKLSKKLPLFIVGFSMLIGAVLIGVSLVSFQKSAFSNIQQQMSSMLSDRRAAVVQLMSGIESDLTTLGASPATSEALVAFAKSWDALGAQGASDLTNAYVNDNPHEAGSKHLMDRAPGDAVYHIDHAHYHPGLRALIESKGYYDAFLINPQGDIVYSVFKEMDYATNLVTGAYKDSGLGKLFKTALRGTAGTVYFADMEPYAPSFGAAAAFVATPVMGANNQIVGVVALQIPVDLLGKIVNNADGLGQTTEVYIIGADHRARTSSRFDGRYEVLEALPASQHVTAALDNKIHFYDEIIGLDGQDVVAFTKPVPLDYANWAIIVEQDMAEVMAPVQEKRNMLMMVGLGVTVIMSLMGALFARSITKPIAGISSVMKEISAGHLSTEVAEAARGDEIGEMGKTLVSMQADLRKARDAEEERAAQQKQQQHVVTTLSAGLLRLSQGDFSEHINETFTGEDERLRADFNKTVQTLNDTVSKVVDAASSIRNGAAEISQSSDDLSHRTESQAATLEQTAAALEEMTASVKSAAESASSVENIMAEAKQEAETSGTIVQSAVTAMTEIEQSSSHISQIIGVIDDIAFQTNLLALNAGVEAARAGEAGRGFAVVASEVRALAQRSSDAAMEIKTLIGDSSKQVERGVDLVGKAGDALQNIVDRVNHISNLVSDIARGAAEQSTGLNEINTGVTQLDQVTQQNAAMVEEATAAGHMLNSDAGELTTLVSQFRIAGQSGAGRSSTVSSAPSQPVMSSKATAHGNDGWDDQDLAPVQSSAQPAQSLTEGNAAKDLWQDF